MESRVKLLGHPVHQILVAFPLGLLVTAAIFDAGNIVAGNSVWSVVAYYMIGAGVTGGLIAGVFGLVDYLAIPAGTRARRVGALHGISSTSTVLSFAVSWFLRKADPGSPQPVALLFSFGGVAFLGLAGWLGGELLNRMGVGIDDGAHLDAGSSLKGAVQLGSTLARPDATSLNR